MTDSFFDRVALGWLLFGVGCSGPAQTDAARPDPCPTLGEAGAVGVTGGALRGHRSRDTCAFLGVPYAAPPVGAMRFRPPEPSSAWKGMLDAAHFAAPCAQLDGAGQVAGSEDCLYANVWAPERAWDGAARPVIVFLHGGGNVADSSSNPAYDAADLAARAGAVIVTVDFRLGALGYLAHTALSAESPLSVSGNWGLLDQIAALGWVRDNAASFGGDPARVTVIGQSAGARNLCALLAAPAARELLGAALFSSGACNLGTLAEAEAIGDDFATRAGCGIDGSAECLRALPIEGVLQALPGIPGPLVSSEWNPNVDGSVVSEAPLDALTAGRAALVPTIVSSNAAEVGRAMPQIDTAEEYAVIVRALYGDALAPALLERYPAAEFATPHDALVALVTDGRYTCALRRTARAARSGGAPVWRMIFAHPLDRAPEFGAYHTLELTFLFRTFDTIDVAPTSRDLATADRLVSYFARFTTTGDPNGSAAEPWPEYEVASDPYLRLDTPPSSAIGTSPNCDFWDSIE